MCAQWAPQGLRTPRALKERMRKTSLGTELKGKFCSHHSPSGRVEVLACESHGEQRKPAHQTPVR